MQQLHSRCRHQSHCRHPGSRDQSISKTRPSRFVILSAAKDLSPARDPSLRSELALRNEGMTLVKRLRLTRKTSSLKCIGPCTNMLFRLDALWERLCKGLLQYHLEE